MTTDTQVCPRTMTEAHTFGHYDIFHLKPEDFLLLKEEKDFWVLHLVHDEGILFDATMGRDREIREWMYKKGYSAHFVYELLPMCTFDWALFTREGSEVDGMERFNW